MRRHETILVSMLIACACAVGPDDGGVATFGGAPGIPVPGAGTGASDDGGASDDDGVGDETGFDDDGPGLLLDVGGGAGDGGQSEGCDKVDFLFVVDNSASMNPNQEALVAAFPGFIQHIRQALPFEDYHLMVVDTDEDPTIACEAGWVACDDPGVCGGYTCGENALLSACDTRLGGGVVAPRGGHTANGDCGIAGGRRYMTESQPDLEGTFACAATTGVSGDWDERPMQSMTEAVSDALEQPGGCNEGFLRDDAILVVTMLTTGDDGTSIEAQQGDPQIWYDALVAAKGGDPTAIVMLLVARPFSCIPALGCTGSKAYEDFVAMFGERGMTESINSDDYVSFFQEAVDLIDTTCDEFHPEG